MQIPVNSQMKWKERYTDEMNRSLDEYEEINKKCSGQNKAAYARGVCGDFRRQPRRH